MFVLNLEKLHSYVDIITNSSTVIYTYSDGSLDKAKELIQAFLDLFEENKSVDEMFTMLVIPDEPDFYEFDEYTGREDDVSDLYEMYSNLKKTGKSDEWFMDGLEKYAEADSEYGYESSTVLLVISKKEEFKDVADKIVKFLYSTYHESVYDG